LHKNATILGSQSDTLSFSFFWTLAASLWPKAQQLFKAGHWLLASGLWHATQSQWPVTTGQPPVSPIILLCSMQKFAQKFDRCRNLSDE
jgi:hypothetical protein